MQQPKLSLISPLMWIEEGLRAYVTDDPHSDVIPDCLEDVFRYHTSVT